MRIHVALIQSFSFSFWGTHNGLITFGSILIQFVIAFHFRQDDLLCLMQLPWGHNRWRCKVFLRFQWDRLQWLNLCGLRLWLLWTIIVAFLVGFTVIVRCIWAGLHPFMVNGFLRCHPLLGIPSKSECNQNLLYHAVSLANSIFVLWERNCIFFSMHATGLTLNTCWQNRRTADRCNVALEPMA